MRDLVHPGVVQIYQVENAGMNDCYYSMEYCKLGSLQGFARRAAKNNIPLGLAEKVNLVVSLCNTVSYAHTRDTVHRDIKPTNILIFARKPMKMAHELHELTRIILGAPISAPKDGPKDLNRLAAPRPFHGSSS